MIWPHSTSPGLFPVEFQDLLLSQSLQSKHIAHGFPHTPRTLVYEHTNPSYPESIFSPIIN